MPAGTHVRRRACVTTCISASTPALWRACSEKDGRRRTTLGHASRAGAHASCVAKALAPRPTLDSTHDGALQSVLWTLLTPTFGLWSRSDSYPLDGTHASRACPQ